MLVWVTRSHRSLHNWMMVLTVTLFLLSFVDCAVKLANLFDAGGGHERSVFSWCDVFESYSDCVGIGVRRGGWMMCGLGVMWCLMNHLCDGGCMRNGVGGAKHLIPILSVRGQSYLQYEVYWY